MKILVQRTGALGDVLDATAITRRLRIENRDALIDVETAHRAVFADNEDVSHPYKSANEYDKVIDLNGAFEKHFRKMHPIDAYSEVAFGDRNTPHEIVFQSTPLGPFISGLLPEKFVVFHPARTWAIRTLPRDFWQKLVQLVDLPVIVTGTMQDHALHGVIDARGTLSLGAVASLIERASCFVCSESGPMILAQSTKTPIVAMLTMGVPEHVSHDGANFHAVRANVPCVGCAADQPAETTYFDCLYGHRNCINAFDAEVVAALIKERA